MLLGDPRSNTLVIDEQGFDDGDGNVPQDVYPVAYEYDRDDNFAVEGERVTIEQFEEILNSPLVDLSGPDGPDDEMPADNATLIWAGFDHTGDDRNAIWRLNGLICSAP